MNANTRKIDDHNYGVAELGREQLIKTNGGSGYSRGLGWLCGSAVKCVVAIYAAACLAVKLSMQEAGINSGGQPMA